jgi:chaperonin cofactor prefoldin
MTLDQLWNEIQAIKANYNNAKTNFEGRFDALSKRIDDLEKGKLTLSKKIDELEKRKK